MDKKNIEDFYDDFVSAQQKTGVSIRHRLIFKKLRKLGLKKNSSVLEIGCGIGTVSGLIIDAIPQGTFLGCDISPESIRFANERYPQKNAEFIVTDMSDFQRSSTYDFVVFPDVLEHIPVDQHARLFKNVASVCHENSQVLINIPEPKALDYYRRNKPEVLQIIDQSLSMQDLLNDTYSAGFRVESIEPYSIHTDAPNYLSIVLNRKNTLQTIRVKGKFSQLIQNLRAKYL